MGGLDERVEAGKTRRFINWSAHPREAWRNHPVLRPTRADIFPGFRLGVGAFLVIFSAHTAYQYMQAGDAHGDNKH